MQHSFIQWFGLALLFASVAAALEALRLERVVSTLN
jgi:hypothetical protein